MPNWSFGDDAIARAFTGPMFSPGDTSLAEYFQIGSNETGVPVNEHSAIGSTAFYRGVSILANTIAGLPLCSYKPDPVTGIRVPVASLMDDPAPLWYTPFEFMSITMCHLILHGNAYLLHVYDGAKLIALFPIHPSMVLPMWRDGGRIYRTTVPGYPTIEYTDQDLTHLMGLSLDGLKGVSLIYAMRNGIGTTLAGDRAAAHMFKSGLMIGGVVSAPGINIEQGKQIKQGMEAAAGGSAKAGELLVIPASLTISPWTMNADDAQFVESRQFQVEEVSRMFGIPKVLFGADGASTWGSGISELDKGMAKYTFTGWTKPIQQRLSRVVRPAAAFCEFDYHGLFEGTPDEEDASLIALVTAGILSIDEARAAKNLPPLPVAALPPGPSVQVPADQSEGA